MKPVISRTILSKKELPCVKRAVLRTETVIGLIHRNRSYESGGLEGRVAAKHEALGITVVLEGLHVIAHERSDLYLDSIVTSLEQSGDIQHGVSIPMEPRRFAVNTDLSNVTDLAKVQISGKGSR